MCTHFSRLRGLKASCLIHCRCEWALRLEFYFYRPKRSFGQGNVFTRVCDSVNRGGACSNFSGGYFFGGGACSNFSGGSVCSKFSGGYFFGGVPAPIFRGGCLLQFFRRGVPAPIFQGGCLLQFFGGCLLQIFGGGVCSIFSGGLQFSEYGHRSAGTHPTGMHSCLLMHLYFRGPKGELALIVTGVVVLVATVLCLCVYCCYKLFADSPHTQAQTTGNCLIF